jgi:hypothetical protein
LPALRQGGAMVPRGNYMPVAEARIVISCGQCGTPLGVQTGGSSLVIGGGRLNNHHDFVCSVCGKRKVWSPEKRKICPSRLLTGLAQSSR